MILWVFSNWNCKMFQLFNYFPWLALGSSHFSKEPWFLLVERSVWKPRSGHYMCSLLLGYHCSQFLSMTELGNMCTYTQSHTQSHTHTPLYSFVRICWKPRVCSDTYNSNLPPQVHFRFSSFHIAAIFVRKLIQNHPLSNPHLGFPGGSM